MTSNPQAERAVIAALMRNPDGHAILTLGIAPDLFTQDATREAYHAISALITDGITPDAATLRGALTDATLIEIETSIQEHVSAANLPTHVALLKACQRKREIEAARQRLAKASAAGAPEHELRAILDGIQRASQPQASTGRFVGMADLCNAPPAENWLIEGYMTLDSLNVLFGDPGSAKSFLAIDLAGHVATGRPWRGRAVKQGTVIYIAGEGRNGLAKRFRAWFEGHDEQPRNIHVSTLPTALTDPASIAALLADLRALVEAPPLVVIDTINRNFGAGDENSTQDMTAAIAGLDALRTATGAAVLGLHHSGHTDKGRGRGSSVLKASTDVEYSIEKNDHAVQVRCTKAKDFDYPPPLAWTLVKQPLPWADADGRPLDSAILEAIELPARDSATANSPINGQPARALRLLEQLHDEHRHNLAATGHDPDQARVTLNEWQEAMRSISKDKGNRNRIRRTLLNDSHVRIDGNFIYPAR